MALLTVKTTDNADPKADAEILVDDFEVIDSHHATMGASGRRLLVALLGREYQDRFFRITGAGVDLEGCTVDGESSGCTIHFLRRAL